MKRANKIEREGLMNRPDSPVREEVPSARKDNEEWLRGRELDEMIDDHGPVILGGRDRKPKFPQSNGEN